MGTGVDIQRHKSAARCFAGIGLLPLGASLRAPIQLASQRPRTRVMAGCFFIFNQ